MRPSVHAESDDRREEHEGAHKGLQWCVPHHWHVAALGEIADVTGGVAKDKKRDAQAGIRQVPYLRVANVQRGYLDLTEVKTIAASEEEIQELRLRPGDVLFNEGGDRDKLGRGWVWNGEIQECIHQNHVFRARIFGRIVEPKFLSHWANSFGQDWFARAGKQTTNLASISLERLKQFPVLLPSADEQERIVAKIEELFSDLDAGIAALERVRKKLQRYRSAALHAAVTGRLTAEWRKAQGPQAEPGDKLLARILVERRKQWEQRTLAKYAKDGRTPPKNWQDRYIEPPRTNAANLPKLPEGWCWASVDQCTQRIQYGTSAKTNDDADGVPVLRMGNITMQGTVDYANLKYLPQNHAEFPELLLEPGDILFNRTNSAELVGKSAVFEHTDRPYSCASYLIRVRAMEGCSPWWLTWCIISPLGRQWVRTVLSHTAGQANVNGTKLGEYVVPLPPQEEQAAIAEAVNEKLSQIDAMEAEVERGLARAVRLRQAILKAAFEGKLVPQNSGDEPAALLERINAERAAAIEARPARSKRPRKMVSP